MNNRYQVRCSTGEFESSWVNAKNVRMKSRRPAPFEADGPYSKIRWRKS